MTKSINTQPMRAQAFNGYHRAQSTASDDTELTRVGPGTPCGEYLRRFWHPVALSEQLHDSPLAVGVLGEELVLFRDLGGRVGLLHKHCSHRRTSLEYGIVAERGLRCCYHGWLFDVDGTILETPGEPENSPIRSRLCHGAYPTHEYRGLVFAYLGPSDLIPEFPLLDTFELPDTELVAYAIDYPCNWLQVAENPMDPFHSVFLHTRATRAQFHPAWGALPVVDWHLMPDNLGIYLTNTRRWGEYLWVRTAETFLPNFAQPPDIYQNPDREKFFPRVGISKWTLPVHDSHCKIIGWRHFGVQLDLDGKGDRNQVGLNKIDFVGQTGVERSAAAAKREPGDYEAQISQGPIAVHALEQRGQTDKGVAMLRHALRDAIRGVVAGREPTRPVLNADGRVPSYAGDVIVRVPGLGDDRDSQQALGAGVGKIIAASLALPQAQRAGEIRRQVQAFIATQHVG